MLRSRAPARLRPRILVRVLPVTFFALLAVWYLASSVASRTVETQLQAHLELEGSRSARSVSAKLETIIDGASALASNDLVVNGLIDTIDRKHYLATFFQSLRIPGPKGAQVSLVDYRGRHIASNGGQRSYRDTPWIDRVMQGYDHLELSGEGLLVAVPVYYEGGAEGAIVAEYTRGTLLDLVHLSEHGEVGLIVDGAGETLFEVGSAAKETTGQVEQAALSEWTRVKRPIPGFPDLFLMLAVNKGVAFAALREMQRYMFGAVLVSLLVIVVAVYLAAWLATKPLSHLVASISAIGNSRDLSHRVPLSGTAEFHDLATSFNTMVERLESTTVSRNRVDKIMNSMAEMLFVTDSRGVIEHANQAAQRLLGLPADTLVGQTVSKIFMDPDTGEDLAELSHVSDLDGPQTVEALCHSPNKLQFPVHLSVSPLIADDGTVSGFVYCALDITARKNAEQELTLKAEELARSNEELEQFASVASHDLQEPLRKVQAFGDRLKSGYTDVLDDQGRDYLSRMGGATARMQTLINDLLSFSRVTTKGETFVTVDMNRVLQDVLSDLEVRIQETAAQVEAGSLPTIVADPLQMRQLLQNLIGNALKYHREGVPPVVRVEAEIEESDPLQRNGTANSLCRIRISDNGIGFDPGYTERIFGIFQRLHGRSAYEGTGVGLAICRKIVERHGGDVDAHGRPGEGASFTINLPTNLTQHGARAA